MRESREVKEAREWYLKAKATLPPQPKAVSQRAGCKVAWYTYRTMAEAKIAAQHARLDAEWYSFLGYDFGYQQPGFISQDKKRRRYEVTFP